MDIGFVPIVIQMLIFVLIVYGLPDSTINQELIGCGQLKNVLYWLFWFFFCGNYLQCYSIMNGKDQ